MTKKQLIERVAARAKIDAETAEAALEALRAIAIERLERDEDFVIPNLVHLRVTRTPAMPARKARNPFTGEEVTMPARPASAKIRGRALLTLSNATPDEDDAPSSETP